MKDDSTLTHPEHDQANSYEEESAQELMTSPQKSLKSYSSQETNNYSKRSTSEEELRSLSTTPRYSHEDLGRVVSPPHTETASTLEESVADPELFDTLSTGQVFLKSRTTSHTINNVYPLAPLSDRGSQKSFRTPAKPVLQALRPRREEHYKSTFSDKDSFKNSTSDLRPDYHRHRAAELMEMRMGTVDENLRDIMLDAETVRRDLSNEHDHRRMLEKHLREIDEERKDLNMKLATLRVKFGVANSNYNVSKTECEQMRKKYQETEIQKARLEERIQTCTKDLGKLKDPYNPDSNVNLKKIVQNDRKEIRRLRTDLEGVKSERSDVQKQIQDRDEKIKMLTILIGEAREQLAETQQDYETAKISVVGERKKREEVEVKYNELLKEKVDFDDKMGQVRSHLDVASLGSSGIQKQYEEYREREQELTKKIMSVERKLKDTMTEVEQQKNKNMPQRTASSIKYHQFRMFRSGLVSETTPHVVVTTNPNASMSASGYLGKTVVSTKPVTSLPGGKRDSKPTPRSKGGSLPSKR